MSFKEFKLKYEQRPVDEYANSVVLEPLVSVCIQTYQHAYYIKECLDGIIMQKTTFPFEILLGEDASSDGTREICIEYAKKYPSIIKLFLHHRENNIKIYGSFSGRFNFMYNLFSAKGKYIAICEGDDYWTDPLKLQKQVDFMENNPGHAMCFHSVLIKDSINNKEYPEVPAENRDYSIDELLLKKTAHTASFVFKRSLLRTERFLDKSVFGGDVILALMMAEQGKVYGFKDCMAVYRKHQAGVTNIDPLILGIDHQKRFINQFVFIKKTFKSLSKSASSIKIVDHCMTVAIYYYKQRNLLAFKYLAKALYYKPDLIIKSIKKIITK